MNLLHKGPILAILILALSACGPAKPLTQSQRDSVVVHIRDSIFMRDTIIMAPIPPESGNNILPDTDTSFLQTSLAESRAYVADGRLHHTLRNRSERLQPVSVQYRDRARALIQVGIHQKTDIVEVEKDLSWWQRFQIAVGRLALIAGLLWLAWKFKHFII